MPAPSRPPDVRLNRSQLVMVAVMGQIAHPVGAINPYRIGQDGVPRVLPGTGGIMLNQRIGDRCVGLMGDHIEPGVALHNNAREVVGSRRGPNLALLTYACIGNQARVISGPCAGQRGLVTGKHGGVDHVLVDFPSAVLRRLQIGDRIQIQSCGLGLRLLDFPDVSVSNCSPSLIQRMGLLVEGNGLHIPFTHQIPAGIMGSGLGKNNVWRGDVDIQLFDPALRRQYRLGSLRFGDLVAVHSWDGVYGAAPRGGRTTIGVVVHGDSTISGHGPGLTVLMSGPAQRLRTLHDPRANLAALYRIREPASPQQQTPISGRDGGAKPRAVLNLPPSHIRARRSRLSI